MAVNISIRPRSPRGQNLECVIDQFEGNDFYFKNSIPQSDRKVFLASSSSPELREKIAETIVKNDVASMSNLSDDEILQNISSKYEDRYTMFNRIAQREIELKNNPPKDE